MISISFYDLQWLHMRLLEYAYEKQSKAFIELGDENEANPDRIVSYWICQCLGNYSLCALTPKEFIVEIWSGERCPVKLTLEEERWANQHDDEDDEDDDDDEDEEIFDYEDEDEEEDDRY